MQSKFYEQFFYKRIKNGSKAIISIYKKQSLHLRSKKFKITAVYFNYIQISKKKSYPINVLRYKI